MSIRLRNLVYDWIQNSPSLKDHIALAYFDDGFFIETKCGGRFTMAWIAEDCVEVETSPRVWSSENGVPIDLNPADPEYFNKLDGALRRWHNIYNSYYEYACQTVL